MSKLTSITIALLLGSSIPTAAEFVWSRFQVRSVSPILFQGARTGVDAVYIADTITPEVCVMVIRDERSGHLAAVRVPRLSCELHGSAQ